MHAFLPLLLASATAWALPRPPGLSQGRLAPELLAIPDRVGYRAKYLREYLLPPVPVLLPRYVAYEDSPRLPRDPDTDWLNKEIDRINRMEEDENWASPYEVPRWEGSQYVPYQEPNKYGPQYQTDVQYPEEPTVIERQSKGLKNNLKRGSNELYDAPTDEEPFALTPNDKGFFDPDAPKENERGFVLNIPHEGVRMGPAMLIQPPREIRQNPNWSSRSKALVAENIDKMRSGLTNKGRLPVSLLPTNLRWLNIKDEESTPQDGMITDKPSHVHVLETTSIDPAESIYGVALIAAVGAALTLAVFGFAFGWYTFSKKAKAAAVVDYPAYGVTGPSVDPSGDRKLAQSAHMYHYQHQKQQIIAMERNGMEHRSGSVSDPESEEENEEGDYTVYECPGFATTGDMEVKNPLFPDEPTPATPGKCEVVKPQPKD